MSVSGDIFVCHDWVLLVSSGGIEGRDAGKRPPIHSTAPAITSHLAHSVTVPMMRSADLNQLVFF